MAVQVPATRAELEPFLQCLWDHHGREEWDGPDDILGVLIRTILSQATTHANTERAFGALLERFEGDWENVRAASPDELMESIRVAGLAKRKARTIQHVLEETFRKYGVLHLQHLEECPIDEAERCLLEFPGVGPKTAKFTVMTSLGGDRFPMDTHIFRFGKRIGVLDGRESDTEAHEKMQALIPMGESYAAHMVLVRHGRHVCHARRPACERCPLSSCCAFAAGLSR